MTLKEGFVLREICGEKVIMAEGLGCINFNRLLCLNDTAAFLWHKAEELGEFTEEQLLGALMEDYDVDEATARKDIKDILAEWSRLEMV